MSEQYLVMKYHPAKKEVEFHRYQNSKEEAIRNNSKLYKYMNAKRGEFVLQNMGNKFFDDISEAFDGLRTLEIRAVMTKVDYDDFCQMIEFYNEEGKCHFETSLIAELPEMDQTFSNVKQHGEEAIAIFWKVTAKSCWKSIQIKNLFKRPLKISQKSSTRRLKI